MSRFWQRRDHPFINLHQTVFGTDCGTESMIRGN